MAAKPGPWTTSPSKYVPGRYVHVDAPNGPQVASAALTSAEDADYIATVDPAFGVAVADWLDLCASTDSRPPRVWKAAVAVARLILGEEE